MQVGKDMKTDIEKYVNSKLEEFEKEMNKKREEFEQNLKKEITWMSRPKNIWDLKIEDGEYYYYIPTYGQVCRGVFNTTYDEWARDRGNAFLTLEEAEFERERREIGAIMKKYSRPFEYNKCNYYIVCDKRYNKIECFENHYVYNGLSYFESEEIARKVADEIGEDRLKKYWFGIK